MQNFWEYPLVQWLFILFCFNLAQLNNTLSKIFSNAFNVFQFIFYVEYVVYIQGKFESFYKGSVLFCI